MPLWVVRLMRWLPWLEAAVGFTLFGGVVSGYVFIAHLKAAEVPRSIFGWLLLMVGLFMACAHLAAKAGWRRGMAAGLMTTPRVTLQREGSSRSLGSRPDFAEVLLVEEAACYRLKKNRYGHLGTARTLGQLAGRPFNVPPELIDELRALEAS